MLWCWIIGMTDLILHNKTGTYDYDDDIEKCNDEVQRLNPHIYNKEEGFQPHFEDTEDNKDTQGQPERDLFN